MARVRYTQGQSIQDLLKIRPGDFANLPSAHQREIVSKLSSAGNKRLRSLAEHGIQTPATMRVQMSGGKFSTRGKDAEGLLKELTRAKRFLGSGQTTVKGWREQERELKRDLQNVGIQSKPETGLAYAIYDLLSDYNADITVQRSKYEIVRRIEDNLSAGQNPEQVYSDAQNWLLNEYERKQREYMNMDNEITETPERYKRRYRKR